MTLLSQIFPSNLAHKKMLCILHTGPTLLRFSKLAAGDFLLRVCHHQGCLPECCLDAVRMLLLELATDQLKDSYCHYPNGKLYRSRRPNSLI